MGGNSNSYVFFVRIITRFQIFAYLTNSQFCVTDYVRIILVDSNDGMADCIYNGKKNHAKMRVGGCQIPQNMGGIGIGDCNSYGKKITQKWGLEDVKYRRIWVGLE